MAAMLLVSTAVACLADDEDPDATPSPEPTDYFLSGKHLVVSGPRNATVKPGGTAEFEVEILLVDDVTGDERSPADDELYITWLAYTPTSEEFLAYELEGIYGGLKVETSDTRLLTLKNIPKDLSGLQLCCIVDSQSPYIESAQSLVAGLYVTDNVATPTAEPTPEPTPEATPEPTPEATA